MRKEELRERITDALFNLILENPEAIFPDYNGEFADKFICGISEDGLDGEITFPTTEKNDDGSPIMAKVKITLLR